MKKLKVHEKFISVNGEGPDCGKLVVFIRLAGCNLSCSYCDTQYACDAEIHTNSEETISELVDYVLQTGVKRVTITGGEPLLQEAVPNLSSKLYDNGIEVTIETNGSFDIEKIRLECRVIMDYKLPSSGMESHMDLDNFYLLGPNEVVKFVCGSLEDLQRAYEISKQLTDNPSIYLSPVFGKIEPSEIVDFIKEKRWNDCTLQIQMHKVIWDPAERGV